MEEKEQKNFGNSGVFKRCAFTLAEVLIVIGVIGVVAAITIPTLIPLIKEKVTSNRKEVIEDRLIQGMNQFNTLDDGFNASQYSETGTEGFVRALSKHYKMSQICGAENLKDCFPYGTINYTDDNGDATANIEDLKTPEAFKLSSEEYYAPAGFISAQGTPFIMLLKKDCIMDTGEGMRAIPTSCVQYMYDNNGSAIPNKLGKDIEYSKNGIGIASIAAEDGGGDSKVDPDGTLDNPIDGYTTYLVLNTDYQGGDGSANGLNTCDDSDDKKWDERGSANSACSNNRWAAAKKACIEAGYDLPTKEQLQEIYCRSKGTNAYGYTCSIKPKDEDLATAIKTKTKQMSVNGYFWTSLPNSSNDAYFVDFDDGYAGPSYNTVAAGYRVICLGK